MGQLVKTDAELVEASRRGERDAFGHLVTRYQDVVCAVSYSSTGNWALSEDVAQDTFIAAWRQLGQLRETGRIRSWLCGIARNLARKARKRTDHEEEVDDELQTTDANPFDVTAQAEVDRLVRNALARVPDTYREALVLYYCENRSIREVAEALGITEAAALQRLTRGRRFLANGVSNLVETSLRAASRRKNLAAMVVAALPLTIPSLVDASTRRASGPSKGSTMLKIGLISAVLAVAATTAVVVKHSASTSRSPSTSSVATAAAPAAAGTAQPHSPAEPQLAQPPHGPAVAGVRPGTADQDQPMVIAKDTIARLALDRGASRGPANAPVTIIVFQDLLCTYCGQVLGTIDQLMDEYPNKLRLVVKQFPVHAEARLAAEASLAADAQGKFWELHDAMIAHQDDLSRDALLAYAQQVGMDVPLLATALDQHTYQPALATEVAAATEIGVRATPEFLINGHDFRGARPIEEFRAAIDAALAEP
jgi:RNA polymerase sigma factor (sigma-70 family)